MKIGFEHCEYLHWTKNLLITANQCLEFKHKQN